MVDDETLRAAMENASKAAPLVIAMEKEITPAGVEEDLKSILIKIQDLLPENTPQRIYISYAWLMLCTQMVSKPIHNQNASSISSHSC